MILIGALGVVVCAWTGVAHAQVTETYVFRDTMEPTEGAGNVLTPVFNGTGTILTSGVGFVDGAYVTHTISASACASTPTVRAWSFPTSGGLRHPNVAPAIVSGSYSISMLMRYNPMDAGYARLVDFSGSTSDYGIYKLGDGVSFYPVGTHAPGSFIADQDVFVTITRDATTQLVSLFIDGIASGTYSDTGNIYAPVASVMYFLMDNTTGGAPISETDPGVISYLQVRDTPMTPAEVVASLATICDTVACGDGIVTTGEACDDGGVLDGDGCSAKCELEPGYTCSGSPSVCVGPPDAGTPDAGLADAGIADAGAADAGIADASVADAGLADGGADDAGTFDAGARDAEIVDASTADLEFAAVDLSSGRDASTAPHTNDGGCGCVVAGSRSGSRGAALAVFFGLALLATRRARRRR
jgi:cysteine-rich repeat protein